MVSPTWGAYMSCSISRELSFPFFRPGSTYKSSNELNLNLSLGANCMWSRAIGSNLIIS